MERMRKSMIAGTSPIAMIAVGGMKGVLDEAQIFAELQPGSPIFTLATTGGAAALLAKQERYANTVRVVDLKAKDLVEQFWKTQTSHEASERIVEEKPRDYYVPYAFIAQQIVADLVDERGRLSRD
jgi:hypothetical protein